MKKNGEESNEGTYVPDDAEKMALSADDEVVTAGPYALILAWLFILFCVWLTGKCLLDMILDRAIFPPMMTLAALFIVETPALIMAHILGTRYTISSSHIEQHGFFGFCRRLAWNDITKIVLGWPRSFIRDITIKAGGRRIVFGAGFIWWRKGFFRTAEAAVAIAQSRGIPVGTKILFAEQEDDVEEWFDIGREKFFPWSKAQLPPRQSPSFREK
ncbi:hypothetical protein DENIS_2042 [Desulfonema ishimotonii]|uniref:Uncharacterized protein n=1 Tax=Desulfonema ishimotonii TaxID=45657 RepID=A0A401FVS3_9BACT|nr:hypothetical protein [Desulfonema ishimotonii]GBC61082.1 hypothetical protein DENIS_2042 [Desulfonema ishimotonii]